MGFIATDYSASSMSVIITHRTAWVHPVGEDKTFDQEISDRPPVCIDRVIIGCEERIRRQFVRSIQKFPLPPPGQRGEKFHRGVGEDRPVAEGFSHGRSDAPAPRL